MGGGAGLGGGLGWAGLACVDSYPSKHRPLGWAGLGWAGLGWTGLDWAGLGWPGLGWAGVFEK